MGNIDVLEEAAAKLPHSTRKMFGGHGLFAPNGGMFAGIVDDDQIMIKFVAETPGHAAFLETGAKPWVYNGKSSGAMTMREWLVIPDELYDDLGSLSDWLARSHKVVPAKGSKKVAPKKKPAAKKAAAKRKK